MNAIAISEVVRTDLPHAASPERTDRNAGIRQLAEDELCLIGGGDVVGNYD